MTDRTVASSYPNAPLFALDTVWFQVAGTICNLACKHCFISCSPANHSHEMMSLRQVETYLEQAERLGAKEYYFTGGEPFMNHEMLEILEATLKRGPATVLTNGLLIKPPVAERLAGLADRSEYSLDLRISIDGWDAASNDPIRGEGTFARILEGIQNAAEAGLNPVITVSEACDGAGSVEGRTRFLELLSAIGLEKPRLKILPLLRLGAEVKRDRAYADWETLNGMALTDPELEALQCTSSRMVTARGVYVCPILIDYPGARLAATLAESLVPFSLRYPSCHTCHTQGLSCRT